MAVEILRARGVDRDLALLFDALAASYRALGDTTAEALARAGARVRSVEATMAGLGRTAFLARPRPDLLPVAGDDVGLAVKLRPDRGVPGAYRLGRVDRLVRLVCLAEVRGEVCHSERNVLDEDLQVVVALPVR